MVHINAKLTNFVTKCLAFSRCGSAAGLWSAGPTSFSSAKSATPASAASSTWRGPTQSTPTPPQPPPRPPIIRKSCQRCVNPHSRIVGTVQGGPIGFNTGI